MPVKLNKYGLPEVLDERDTAHNAGFCALANLFSGNIDEAEEYTGTAKATTPPRSILVDGNLMIKLRISSFHLGAEKDLDETEVI